MGRRAERLAPAAVRADDLYEATRRAARPTPANKETARPAPFEDIILAPRISILCNPGVPVAEFIGKAVASQSECHPPVEAAVRLAIVRQATPASIWFGHRVPGLIALKWHENHRRA